MMKLKNSFYQAIPGQTTVTMWERVDDRGREHAAKKRGGTGDPATVSPGEGITQPDIKDCSEDL